MLWLTPDALQDDPDGYLRLATNLVDHRTFSSGYSVPTAYRPPLYSLVLTGPVLVGAHDPAIMIIAMMMLHVLLGVATVYLVFVLARCWGLGRTAAAVAAVLTACDPILLRSSTVVMTETLATLLATGGLLALTWTGRRGTMLAAAPSNKSALPRNAPRLQSGGFAQRQQFPGDSRESTTPGGRERERRISGSR